jgi:hypothetical protein
MQKGAKGMVQVIYHLPGKNEALSSNPGTITLQKRHIKKTTLMDSTIKSLKMSDQEKSLISAREKRHYIRVRNCE